MALMAASLLLLVAAADAHGALWDVLGGQTTEEQAFRAFNETYGAFIDKQSIDLWLAAYGMPIDGADDLHSTYAQADGNADGVVSFAELLREMQSRQAGGTTPEGFTKVEIKDRNWLLAERAADTFRLYFSKKACVSDAGKGCNVAKAAEVTKALIAAEAEITEEACRGGAETEEQRPNCNFSPGGVLQTVRKTTETQTQTVTSLQWAACDAPDAGAEVQFDFTGEALTTPTFMVGDSAKAKLSAEELKKIVMGGGLPHDGFVTLKLIEKLAIYYKGEAVSTAPSPQSGMAMLKHLTAIKKGKIQKRRFSRAQAKAMFSKKKYQAKRIDYARPYHVHRDAGEKFGADTKVWVDGDPPGTAGSNQITTPTWVVVKRKKNGKWYKKIAYAYRAIDGNHELLRNNGQGNSPTVYSEAEEETKTIPFAQEIPKDESEEAVRDAASEIPTRLWKAFRKKGTFEILKVCGRSSINIGDKEELVTGHYLAHEVMTNAWIRMDKKSFSQYKEVEM